MRMSPTRVFTAFTGGFLLLQGTTTLAALLLPAFDRAVPWLLQATQMVPSHSMLHIVTAFFALAVLYRGGPGGWWWFSLLFGLFYAGLGLAGPLTGHPLGLGLKSFDHPFHFLLGVLGLAAAWMERRSADMR